MTFNLFDRKHAEGFYTAEDIAFLYQLQGELCYFCDAPIGKQGEKDCFHIDHLSPITKGGTNWPGNLSLACATCNKRKYNHDTAKLWKQLQVEKGAAWCKSKIARNRSQTAKKTALTKQRKLERHESLALVAEQVEAAVAHQLETEGYSRPTEIQVFAEQSGCYLSVWFNNSRIEFPAPSQAALLSWSHTTYASLARSLVSAEALAGYLKTGEA